MFRTVPLSSSGVFHCTYSNGICHTGLLCVQWKTPDDGQRNCPKHSKNKFEKLVHLVGFIIRTPSVTRTQKSYPRNQQSHHSRTIIMCFRWRHYKEPRSHSSPKWLSASNPLGRYKKNQLLVYISSWVECLLLLGCYPTFYATLTFWHRNYFFNFSTPCI